VFVDIEELVGAAIEVERVLGELGETPYEPLREEQEEDTLESRMENPITSLNNALINFLKESVPTHISSFSHTMFDECQICGGGDHIATTCPRLNTSRPQCPKYGGPHRTANCGVECPSHSGLRLSEDKDWRKHNKGKSHFGAANFLRILLNDEAETATVADKTPQQQPAAELAEATDGIDVMIKDVLKTTGMTVSKELGPELGATNKELANSIEDRFGTSLVELTTRIENHTNIVSGEPSVDTRSELPEEQVSTKDEAKDLTPEGQPVEGLMKEVDDADLHQDEGMDSEIAKNKEERSS
jgi:hypothetical protein